KSRDPRWLFLVAEDTASRPMGQIRCDLENGKGVVSISVDPVLAGRGLGTEIVRLGTDAFFRDRRIDSLHAYVKGHNDASKRIFVKAGFDRKGTVVVRNEEA